MTKYFKKNFGDGTRIKKGWNTDETDLTDQH